MYYVSYIVAAQSRGHILAVWRMPHATKVVIFEMELVGVGGKVMTNLVNDLRRVKNKLLLLIKGSPFPCNGQQGKNLYRAACKKWATGLSFLSHNMRMNTS